MDKKEEIMIELISLNQYFGLKEGEIMKENPGKFSLKIFPTEEFALKMQKLEKLQTARDVRVQNVLFHHLCTVYTSFTHLWSPKFGAYDSLFLF